MEPTKVLSNAIDFATSDAQQGPNSDLYNQVEKLITSRADMPKHCLVHVSKRLMIKNDKVTILTIDLLEYLMYATELPFWSQLCTKQFLLKISQILQSKEQTSQVSQKILQFIKSEYEIFKPHQDLLPTFFVFYEGLVKKGYDQKSSYLSPYRPKELKKYAQKVENKPKISLPSMQSPPTTYSTPINSQPSRTSKSQPQKFTIQGIRERIVLTNEIIDECNPAQQIKDNNLLMQMMTSLKQIEKTLNNMINEGCNEKTMEQAIALNDDLIITFRRFKDLQKNRKPQPFIKTELASDYILKEEPKPFQKKEPRSIFDQFDLNEPAQTKKLQKPQGPKKQLNIFEFDDSKQQPQTKLSQQSKESLNIFDMDEPKLSLNTNSNPIHMNTISSVQTNMNTMSVPMQNVPNFNSGLLGLNLGPPQSKPQTGFNFNASQSSGGFNFGNITTPPIQIDNVAMNNNSTGFIYNNEFSTQAVKIGKYTQSDLTDLTDLFSKKL